MFYFSKGFQHGYTLLHFGYLGKVSFWIPKRQSQYFYKNEPTRAIFVYLLSFQQQILQKNCGLKRESNPAWPPLRQPSMFIRLAATGFNWFWFLWRKKSRNVDVEALVTSSRASVDRKKTKNENNFCTFFLGKTFCYLKEISKNE